jgi:hypothetical protein
VSEPGDASELLAEREAERVLSARPVGPSAGDAATPAVIQRASVGSGAPVAAREPLVPRGGGEPLPARVRDFFEPRFGRDLGDVRVHTDADAAEAAQSLAARGYAVGRHVVFGAGQFAPGTSAGDRLLAHELAHVVYSAHEPVVHRDVETALLRQEPEDLVRPTFGNLPRDEPDQVGMRRRVELVEEEKDVWYEKWSNGQKFRAQGPYRFVVQDGKIWAVKGPINVMGGPNFGHTEAAAGGPVEYAGTVRFGHGTTTRGHVKEWSNASGHYAPVRYRKFAEAAGLPMDRFKPVMGGNPELGPQLPVFQKQTRSRDGGKARVPPGPPREIALTARYGSSKTGTSSETPDAQKTAEPPAVKKPAEPQPVKRLAEPPPPAGKVAEAPPAGKPAKTPPDPEPSSRSVSGGSGSTLVGTAATAAQRAFTGIAGHAGSQLYRLASQNPKDKETADAIADINKLLDAHAFVSNPAHFTAQYIAGYLVNGAFGKLSRRLAAAEAQFFSTYPDVQQFHSQSLGQGTSLDDLDRLYRESVRILRLPSARKTLATAFVFLGITGKTPQSEIDLRKQLLNEYLARQPDIGLYVTQYNEAQKKYAFGLAWVRLHMDALRRQLSELPPDFADEIGRRGDALLKAARIVDDFYNKVVLLSALPGADMALYMLMTLSDGLTRLGEQLHLFAYRAGARQREYEQEIMRLEARADQIGKLQGAFDAMYQKSLQEGSSD